MTESSRKARSLDSLETPKKVKKTSTKKASKKAAKKAPRKKATKKKSPRVVVPTAKTILSDLRAMKEVSDGDFAFYSDPIAWTSNVEEWIPTGCIAIDRLIGGGWPVGRIIEIASWEGVGKSTLLDQSFAMAQDQGHIACLIDSEQARDAKYMKRLGVKLDELIVHKAETVEDAFEGLDRMLAIQEAHVAKLAKVGKRPPAMLIGLDSLAGLPTLAERDGSASDKHVAEAAKRIKFNFRRLAQRIAHARASLVFTNQFYQDIGPFASIKTSGGSGVRYYTSIRLWLTRKASLKTGDSIIGHEILAKLKKTKVGTPRAPQTIGLIYGAGIHNAYTLFEWGKGAGDPEVPGHCWVEQRGSWAYLMLPDGTWEGFQGKAMGLAEKLTERPEVYAQMASQYLSEAA